VNAVEFCVRTKER